MSEPAKEASRKLPKKSLWITFNNVRADTGKFRVCLEIDGEELELFHSYPSLEDGVVCESRNLTWLLKPRATDPELEALRELEQCLLRLFGPDNIGKTVDININFSGRAISMIANGDAVWAVKQALEKLDKLRGSK